MWAVARYDFGLTDEEFGRLTLPEFQLLWDRRVIDWKRQCFLQGITASAVYNVHRYKPQDHVFSPYDFVPRSEEDSEREDIIWQLKKLPFHKLSHHELMQQRSLWQERLHSLGRDDVDTILDAVFPKESK